MSMQYTQLLPLLLTEFVTTYCWHTGAHTAWHARSDTIVNTVNALLHGAADAANACRNDDIQTLGATLSHYYELKQVSCSR
jgi:hypothetical protein